MEKRNIWRGAAAVAVVMAGAFATIGEGSTGSTGSGSNPAPNASSNSDAKSSDSSTKDAAGADKAKPIPVGTEVKVSSGWDLKVNSAEVNANETVAKANQFITPDAGKQFVLVNVTMINKSGKPDSPLTNVKISLLPPSGVAIDSDIMGSEVPDACDETTQLQPDAQYTCNEVFQAKPDEADASLVLAEPQFTLDESGAQRFFALK